MRALPIARANSSEYQFNKARILRYAHFIRFFILPNIRVPYWDFGSHFWIPGIYWGPARDSRRRSPPPTDGGGGYARDPVAEKKSERFSDFRALYFFRSLRTVCGKGRGYRLENQNNLMISMLGGGHISPPNYQSCALFCRGWPRDAQ
jgi:hypothetical protein